LLKNVPMIAGVIISTNVATQSLFAQAKATHEAAKYQDHPKDGQQCSGCQFFVVPNSCKVVEDTQSQRADGANSSQPSLPDAPQRLIREADARTARSSWGVGFGRVPSFSPCRFSNCPNILFR
jgi:hypothetical protein